MPVFVLGFNAPSLRNPTQTEWIPLPEAQTTAGQPGPQGPQGPQGPKGAKGEKGEPADATEWAALRVQMDALTARIEALEAAK